MTVTYASMCRKRRGFDFKPVSSAVPLGVARSQGMTDCIRLCYKYRTDKLADIAGYLKSRYMTSDSFVNPQVIASTLMRDAMLIRRAVASEGAKGMERYHLLYGDDAKTADMLEIDPAQTRIAVVKFYIGKNDNKKSSVCVDLTLYKMIQLGRQKATEIFPQTKDVVIDAEMRYLRKDSDKGLVLDPNFFGSNILTMTDTPTLDAEMQKDVQLDMDGIDEQEIPEEECEQCKFFNICRYTDPPVPIPTVPAGSKGTAFQWTDDQKFVINWNSGALSVIAGAGTGKTACVVEHVVVLLKNGVQPERILMITYTTAGAGEMRERIRKRVQEEKLDVNVDLIHICTFHAFSNEIVLDRYEDVGLSAKPTVIKSMNRMDIIDKMITENPIPGWSGRAFRQYDSQDAYFGKGALQIAADVFAAVKEIKAAGDDPTTDLIRSKTDVEDTPDYVLSELITRYDQYEANLKQRGLIEFADMPAMMFEILDKNPGYLEEKYPFEHIVVDEFQDSNEGQISLINRLVKLPSFKSLVTVGDDAQSIMGFQGASPEFILHLDKYLSIPVVQHQLVENHRSRQLIIDTANAENALRINKIDKDLVATRTGGFVKPLGFYKRKGDSWALTQAGWKKVGEVDWTVAEIIRKIVFEGRSPEDIAVITYTKRELEDYADALTNANRTIGFMKARGEFDKLTDEQNARLDAIKNGIPSMFCAPELLSDNSRITAIVAFGRFLQDRTDTTAALTVYNAIIHGHVMDLPHTEIEEGIDLVRGMAEEIDSAYTLPEKKELFMTFINMISQGDETVEAFRDSFENEEYDEMIHDLSIFPRFGQKDTYKRAKRYPGVTLVTAHSSKGLEWPIVFNSVSRYMKPNMSRNAVEETRRLLFVSETRARDELYVTGLFQVGTKKYPALNMFLEDAYDTMPGYEGTWDQTIYQ